MIKTPLSTMIGGALWTPETTVIGGTSKKTFDPLIQSLFSNSEQGFFYDPNDLTTMFQDAAGTIPVTAVGQPVGLLLDKSKKLALANVLNVYGHFTSNLSGWRIGSATSAVIESGEARVTFGGTFTASSSNWFSVYAPYYAGERYTVSFDATYVSGGNLQAGFGHTVGMTVLGVENAGVKQTYTLTAGGTTDTTRELLAFGSDSAGSVWKIDNVSVKKVQGNHAFQATSTSRPILRKNTSTGANYLEFDGTDDFLKTSFIEFNSANKLSLFAAIHKSSTSAGMLCELSADASWSTGSFYLITPQSSGVQSPDSFLLRGTIAASKSYVTTPSSKVIYSIQADMVNKSIAFKTNGVLRAPTEADVGDDVGLYNYPLFIGRRNGPSIPFNGHLYSLVGVTKLASETETTDIENALSQYSGVRLNV